MRFNTHSGIQGHALLSPSKYHWINYDEEKMEKLIQAAGAAQRGTELHILAHQAIRLGVKLYGRNTLSMYVNDAIGFGMVPEQILFYSINAYGTADTIKYQERNRKLRIHDLKTGTAPASYHQLEVYAALFCLEYGFKPFELDIELRIYQNNEVLIFIGDPDAITRIMDVIVMADRRIEALRMEGLM